MKTTKYLPYLLGAFSLGLLFYLCGDALSNIFSSWQQEEYSYAYFIPALALLIGLHQLSGKTVRPSSSWVGVCTVVLGLCFWAIGEKSGVPNLPQYGFLGLIYGIFFTFLGWSVVRTVWPALIYLFFAIPLPNSVYFTISAKMQLISSDVGFFILQLVGVSSFQDGNIIDVGNYKMEVVEACNGLRYLFPLISFGFLFAVLLEDVFWKRCIVFLSAIPLAIGFNALRISVIGMIAGWGGSEEEINIVHDIEGWVIFFICVMCLYVEVSLLRRIPPHGIFADRFFSIPSGPFFTEKLRASTATITVATLLSITSLAYYSNYFEPKQEIIPNRNQFTSFPYELGSWSGNHIFMTDENLKLLKLTDFLNMSFTNKQTQEGISVYVAYYDSQRNKRTFHSPSVCLPGNGWKTVSQNVKHIDFGKDGNKRFSFNRTVIQKGLKRNLVYYWFEQRGVSVPSYNQVKGRVIIDSIILGRTDGALVRFITPLYEIENEGPADKRLMDFIGLSATLLNMYVPDYSIKELGEKL